MKCGITLIECLVYLACCSLFGMMSATLIIAWVRDGDGLLRVANSALASHSILQSLAKDVERIRLGEGIVIHKKPAILTCSFPEGMVTWSSNKGRIIHTTVTHGKRRETVLASRDAHLLFIDEEYGVQSVVTVKGVSLKRFFCLKNSLCRSFS
jgi:hypothetical protein